MTREPDENPPSPARPVGLRLSRTDREQRAQRLREESFDPVYFSTEGLLSETDCLSADEAAAEAVTRTRDP